MWDFKTIILDFFKTKNFQEFINHRYKNDRKIILEKNIFENNFILGTDKAIFYFDDMVFTIKESITEYIYNDLRKTDVVLDIGSCFGGFSLNVCDRVKHIYAVAGSIGNATAHYNGTLANVIILADVIGNVSIDVYQGNYSTYPIQTKIGTITLTKVQKYTYSVYSGFTSTTFVDDDNFAFNITSASNITWIKGDIETVRT
jgi:hypothetical protein